MVQVYHLDAILEVADKVLGVFDYSVRGKDVVFTVYTRKGDTAQFTLKTSLNMNLRGLEKLMHREKATAIDKLTKRNRECKVDMIAFCNSGSIVRQLVAQG